MKILSANDLAIDLRARGCKQPICLNQSYAIVSHRWITDHFVPFWRDYTFELGLPRRIHWECENWSLVCAAQARVAALRRTAQHNPAWGMLVVRNPGDSDARRDIHALCLVATERGLIEFEPQNCGIRPLRHSGLLLSLL